ncbi:hypothetical protein H5410_028383, partial [Solanum commersonii]
MEIVHGGGKNITGGYGVDVAVEALWRPQTFLQCVQSVRNGGKAVMIGLTLSGLRWRTCKYEEAPQAYKDLDQVTIAGYAAVEI